MRNKLNSHRKCEMCSPQHTDKEFDKRGTADENTRSQCVLQNVIIIIICIDCDKNRVVPGWLAG